MAEKLNKGWWTLNLALILSYALTYYILFVPNSIFNRPEYFVHAYISIILSLLIYAIIYFLFFEIQAKINIEHDKQKLSIQVTSLAAESAEITTIAYKDSLTGLNNRYSLFRQMDQLIQNKQGFLVIFIDLDNLKEVNDTYSHAKGDAYLIQFGIAIQNTIKDQGEVYRFAGDEFVCIIKHNYDQFNSEDFKNNIYKEVIFDIPFHGLSLGLACYPQDGLNADDLINLADQGMYTEKKDKENRR
jgi:diguanylate cyclase (GGDEF)-like protein